MTQPKMSQGVRKLTLADQRPDCEVVINAPLYDLAEMSRGKAVVDIGCGYGWTRPIVEGAGGTWVGVEPFEGGGNTVTAPAEDLPFADGSFDLVVMEAVLEHLPELEASFAEVARVLKPGGKFIGYCAFMECFHEISYHHLSFKALEHLSRRNGLRLVKVGGGMRFGIDHHLSVLFYPLPFKYIALGIAASIRGLIRVKSLAASVAIKFKRGLSWREAFAMGRSYYELECLRQSIGFTYVIEKPLVAGAP